MYLLFLALVNKKLNIIIFCVLCLGFIGCDQVTKGWARSYLDNREPVSIFHDTIRLIYVENTGAFMSWGAEWSQNMSFWIFTILPVALLLSFLVYVLKKWSQISILQAISFCMIFSGGIGNVIDRIVRHRHVTDFINLGFQDFRTGIFNVADLYVTIGVLFFAFSSLKPSKKLPDQDLL
jgi:signal peptidase II